MGSVKSPFGVKKRPVGFLEGFNSLQTGSVGMKMKSTLGWNLEIDLMEKEMTKERVENKIPQDVPKNLAKVYDCPSLYVDLCDIRSSSSSLDISSGIIRITFIEQAMHEKQGFVRSSVSMNFDVAKNMCLRLQQILRMSPETENIRHKK